MAGKYFTLQGGKAFWTEFYIGTYGAYEDAQSRIADDDEDENDQICIRLMTAIAGQRTEFTGKLNIDEEAIRYMYWRLNWDVDKWLGWVRYEGISSGHLVKSGYRMLDTIRKLFPDVKGI